MGPNPEASRSLALGSAGGVPSSLRRRAEKLGPGSSLGGKRGRVMVGWTLAAGLSLLVGRRLLHLDGPDVLEVVGEVGLEPRAVVLWVLAEQAAAVAPVDGLVAPPRREGGGLLRGRDLGEAGVVEVGADLE